VTVERAEAGGLAAEDRRRLDELQRDAEHARARIDALREQAEALRAESAQAREDAAQARSALGALEGGALAGLDELRREHEQARALEQRGEAERLDAAAEAMRLEQQARRAEARADQIDPEEGDER
jgi:outer membrane murein-binding lipoprotein Lpp